MLCSCNAQPIAPLASPTTVPTVSPVATPLASPTITTTVSKREAIDQLLQQIYHNSPDSLVTFVFVENEHYYGYEGMRREDGHYYTTMCLEYYERFGLSGYYEFWLHEYHYWDNGEFDRSVTSNFYLVDTETGEIIPERIYFPDGSYEYNDEYELLRMG